MSWVKVGSENIEGGFQPMVIEYGVKPPLMQQYGGGGCCSKLNNTAQGCTTTEICGLRNTLTVRETTKLHFGHKQWKEWM
jgi:hypothetical protein